jgi:ribonuclease III
VLEEFGQHFGVRFRDPALLKLALTHRSYLHVTGQGPRESNERLEFLGDSVLGLVTSENLYRKHPTEHEGQLTKTKSLLVSKAILSRRALAMGLGRFVFMSHSEVESGGRQRLSILADAFESVVGAIYLDQGFEAARAWLDRWLLRDARTISADKRHTNYKSHLQEYVQSTYRTHPVYRIRSAMGPDHSKMFMVEVMVGRRVLGEGRGKNKKEAEQAAARAALERAGSPVTHEEEPRSAGSSRREARGTTLLPEPDELEPVSHEADGDEDEDEPRRRRRSRRGGRGRRDREFEGAEPTPAPAPVAAAPRPREVLPPSRPRRVRFDEDAEEVGRPEGLEHESHEIPHHAGWPSAFAGTETAPEAPSAEPATREAFAEPEAEEMPRSRPAMSFGDMFESAEAAAEEEAPPVRSHRPRRTRIEEPEPERGPGPDEMADTERHRAEAPMAPPPAAPAQPPAPAFGRRTRRR